MAENNNNAKKTRAIDKKIKFDVEQHSQLLMQAREHFIRFSGVANAGGIVATMAVIGAMANSGKPLNILALPLALFASGVICALLHTLNAYVSSCLFSDKELSELDAPLKWIFPYAVKYVNWFTSGMIVFFISGCITGVIIIAFS